MGWVDKISAAVNNALSALRPPAITIPPILLLCEIMDRPGLSAITLTSSVVARLPEIGIPTGVNPDGSANMICQFVRIFTEEFIKEIKTHGVVTCVPQPGSFNIVGTGTAAGIPSVAVTGSNVGFTTVSGIIQ